MSAVSIMGNSTVSMAFWGSWFCPGGSGGEALMSACPAFGSLSEQHPTSCQCRILSLLCLQVTLRKEQAVQRTEQKNRSLTLGGDFPGARKKSWLLYFHSPSSLPNCKKDLQEWFQSKTWFGVVLWFFFFCVCVCVYLNFLVFFTGIALQRAFGC